MLKWTTIIAGIIGLSVAIYVVATGNKDSDKPPPPPAAPPSVNPFGRGIAATGLVEAASRNLTISAPDAAVVVGVMKQVGETVKKDEPLYQLDGRPLQAELQRAQAQLESAKAVLAVSNARLSRMRSMPRPEEVPALSAQVARAKARLTDDQRRYAELTSAGVGNAATKTEIDQRKWQVEASMAEMAEAEAKLNLMKSGAWSQDLLVGESEVRQAEAGVKQAEADIAAIQIRVDRLTVRSPIDGIVLKRNVEPGQYASTGPNAPASFVVGDTTSLRVRARVDEEDAPQLRDGSEAAARIRGVSGETIPLRWLRVEPLAQPKTDLTGTNTERVDTRVVEVIFEVAKAPKARLFPGQIVDVYIRSEDSLAAEPAAVSAKVLPK